MGFKLRRLDPSRTLKKNLKAQINLGKNPFDKDAHKAAFVGNFEAATPIMANKQYDDRKIAAREEQAAIAEQARLNDELAAGTLQRQIQNRQNMFNPSSFADLFNQQGASQFNQPQFDYSQVSDVYQRGAMPNNLLNRYNSLMGNLQAQQSAMVPRNTQQPTQGYGYFRPQQQLQLGNPYMNFSQLFGGR